MRRRRPTGNRRVRLAAAVGNAHARVHPIPSGATDADLVARAQQRERWAEEAIYRRHVPHIANMTARLLRSRIEAEDVVQDVFAAAFRRINTLRDGAALGRWLSQIAV